MSDRSGPIHVLYVGANPGGIATFLEEVEDRIRVNPKASAEDALDRLTEGIFDCVVSEHDLPDDSGLDLLTRAPGPAR